MKGRQLTLEEVLRLDDGTKIWVEELFGLIDSELYTINKEDKKMYNKDGHFL